MEDIFDGKKGDIAILHIQYIRILSKTTVLMTLRTCLAQVVW